MVEPVLSLESKVCATGGKVPRVAKLENLVRGGTTNVLASVLRHGGFTHCKPALKTANRGRDDESLSYWIALAEYARLQKAACYRPEIRT